MKIFNPSAIIKLMTKKPRLVVISVFTIAVLFLFIPHLFAKKHYNKNQNAPITVNIATVAVKPMPLERYLTGTIEPVKSVNIRSQVTGTLQKISFSPGQTIKAGQMLFQLDPSSFHASLKQAIANMEKSKAKLFDDQTNVERFKKLVKNGYVSQQQYDQAVSTAAIQKATVAADQESVNQATIQLNYTKISAPINGKTGNLSVKEGDLITANDSLVTINQLDPVLVDFNLPQTYLTQLISYQTKNPIMVEVWNETKTQLLGKGELDFIDNNVNTASGTILLKAKVPNPQQLMWPGLMVSVKLILTTETHALVIPSIAIKVDQEGNFVFKVENGKAVVKRVTTSRQVGSLSVIQHGLSAGDQVVTLGSPDLKNLSDIQISNTSVNS